MGCENYFAGSLKRSNLCFAFSLCDTEPLDSGPPPNLCFRFSNRSIFSNFDKAGDAAVPNLSALFWRTSIFAVL